MKKYDFDKLTDRYGTASLKYELTEKYFGKKGLLPFWVADMDFETPPFVCEAILKRAQHPIYGYTFRDERFYDAIIGWMLRRHGWQIEKEWIVFTPGVVPALNLAVLAFTEPEQGVVVQPPVYFPFFGAVANHGRKLIRNQLSSDGNNYTINFQELETQAAESSMLMLCNPHNPVGRSWSRAELKQLAEICDTHKLTVVSDEIHADLVLPGYKHTVFATLDEATAQRTITLHAPSKTFNLAGLHTAFAIIPSETLRKQFEHQIEILHLGMGNLFGFEALIAAFNNGDEWLDQLLDYLSDNVKYTNAFLAERLPQIKVYPTEATYLMWLNFSKYNLKDRELRRKLIEEAGLALSRGLDFGPGGNHFMRLNVACPRAMLTKGLQRLAEVFV